MKKRGPYKKKVKVQVNPMQVFAEKLVRFLALNSHDEYVGARGYRFKRINARLNGLRGV